jgi:type VI secretion system protein ImpK
VVEANLLSLHPNGAPLSIERSGLDADLEIYVAENSLTQLERIRQALAPEIEAGPVEVGLIGDYVFVRVGNLLLFDSGSSTVRDDFAPLAARISETLNTETGPVRVVGHTDSIPLSGRGPIKTNLDLSVARAEAVTAVLATQMIDPSRLTVEGRGAADPIADNATREGRASNRRVEVLLAREGTF